MNKILLSLVAFIFLAVSVSAAMDPIPFYCEHQGYDYITIYSTEYEGNHLERWHYFEEGYSHSKINLKFNEEFYELNRSIRDIIQVNNIVLGIDSASGDLNWTDKKDYCFFDDQNKCDPREFYEGKCGPEYKRDIPCRQEGEVLFSQFEECCDGLESSAGGRNKIVGQSTCVKNMNFFQKLWSWIF